MRRLPVKSTVSQTLSARACTVKRRPQYAAISGMKGRPSTSPRSSSVAMISAGLFTSTRSPRRSCSTGMVVSEVKINFTPSRSADARDASELRYGSADAFTGSERASGPRWLGWTRLRPRARPQPVSGRSVIGSG